MTDHTAALDGSEPQHDHEHESDHAHGDKGDHHDHHAQMVADFKRRFFVSLALTVPILVLSPMLQDLAGLETALQFEGARWVRLVLASAVFAYGGKPFLAGLWDELRKKDPGMMTLIGLAITVAYVYSAAVSLGFEGRVFFWELATLIDIMLLGHWIEMKSVMGASRALEKLAELMPSEAHRLDEHDRVEDVPVSELKNEDRVLVRPGEKVPTDGVIVEGEATLNQAMLTGESEPVRKQQDDEVMGGSVNGDRAFTFAVTRTGEDSYLSQVIDLVDQAQSSRSRSQDLANRAARWLTFAAVGAGILTFGAWVASGQGLDFSLQRMVTVMVITCPHALGLAVPLVVAVSTSMSAKNGLLIRDRGGFERARRLDAVVFDKTGTLTEGSFGVTDVLPASGASEEEVLGLAAAIEKQSEHPIARGIVQKAEERGLQLASPEDFRAIKGSGVQARLDGHKVMVVSPGQLQEQGISGSVEGAREVAGQGKTVVYVVRDDEVVGALALADPIREQSRDAIRQLKQMGVQVMMLTGDAEPVARRVAGELGLDDYFAEVLPDKKASEVEKLQSNGRTVAMVGDGVNDAPALATADVGIAIGAGTDVAVESADIVLVRSDPRDVASVVSIARATYRKMVQNLWWAAGYNIVAIPLAAGVLAFAGILLSPAVGAVLMSLSTVIVAINAKRLRHGRAEVAVQR